jgi:hypothetical protein
MGAVAQAGSAFHYYAPRFRYCGVVALHMPAKAVEHIIAAAKYARDISANTNMYLR